MLIHDSDRSTLIDFFVEAPGQGGTERTSELVAAPVEFTDSVSQVFNIGAASCGVPGTAAGLERALRDFGSMPLSELVAPAISAARDGVASTRWAPTSSRSSRRSSFTSRRAPTIYAPEGRLLGEGDTFRFPELADALELFGAEGSEPFYRGEIAQQGQRLGAGARRHAGARATSPAYEPVVREPVRAHFRDREVVTNPAAVVGRNPHRLRARAARPDRLRRASRNWSR